MAGNLPTKKQRELLSFIDGFIKGNGYSPSFREIQRSLDYRSVSTVATHVNTLISKGYLRKIDNSARTLEVCTPDTVAAETPAKKPDDSQSIAWLEKQRDLHAPDSDSYRVLQAALDCLNTKE